MAITQLESGGIKNDAVIASKIAEDAIAISDLAASGTPSSTNFLCGNNTWMGIGGDLPVDYNDNIKARFGTGNDLEIYHNGSHSFINNTTGYLLISNTGANSTILRGAEDVFLQTASGDQGVIARANGAAELYYDDAKKFETFSWGVQNYGNVACRDNDKHIIGNNSDLQLYHDGNHSYIDNHTGSLKIRNAAAGNILIQARDDDEGIIVKPDGAVELYYDNALKLSTASGGVNVAGNLNMNGADNYELRLGAGNDLKIYHNGTSSYIDNSTGNLNLVSDATIWIGSKTGTETYLKGTKDDSVELYFNNTKRFETTTGGAKITGNGMVTGDFLVDSDSGKLKLGLGEDLRIYHDGTDNYIYSDNKKLYVCGNGSRISMNPVNAENSAKFHAHGNVELYYDNSKKLETTSAGVTVTGGIIAGGLTYPTSDGSNGQALITNGSGTLSFATISGGGGGGATGTDYNDNVKVRFGNSNDLEIYHSGYHSYILNSGSGNLYLQDNDYVEIGRTDEAMLGCVGNGAVNLYYDASKKFETTSTGIAVSGNVKIYDGNKILCGHSNDLEVFHDGGNSWVKEVGTGALYLDTYNGAGIFITANNANENMITAYKDGAVSLYYDNSKKFETNSAGVHVTGRAHIGHTTADPAPTSGSHTGNLLISNTDDNYGMQFGTRSSGKGWIQQTRVDGTATDYDLQLQPAGGHVWMPDNSHLMFGSGNDLKIYHNGNNSFIRDEGTGNLYIESVDGHIYLRVNSSENAIKCTENGNVEICYDGSKKLETNSTGIGVTGQVNAGTIHLTDGNGIHIGNSNDLKIYHDGSNSYINESGTGGLKLLSSGVHIKNAADNAYMAFFGSTGASELYFNGSKKIETTSSGISVTGNIIPTGYVRVGDGQSLYAGSSNDLQIYHDGTNSHLKNSTGTLVFRANNLHINNKDSNENLATFTANGAVNLYYDNAKKLETRSYGVKQDDNVKHTWGNNDDLQILHDGNDSYVSDQGTGSLKILSNAFKVLNAGANEAQIYANENGAVELYYDNSKKFETSSTGIAVHGLTEGQGNASLFYNSSTGQVLWDQTPGTGKILQVVTNTITGAQSGTNNSDSSENTTDLTGFSLNITPSSTSSKILVMATISQSSTNWSFMVHAYRDSTIIAKGDDLGGNRSEFTFCIGNARDYNDATGTSTVHIIDSPSTTSQVTYKLKGCTRGSNSTWHINRSARHSQYNNAWIHSTVSTFTLMEIG